MTINCNILTASNAVNVSFVFAEYSANYIWQRNYRVKQHNIQYQE